MRYIQLVRVAVLLFPFLSLVVVSGCSGSPGGSNGAAANQDPDRHRSGQERPGGMMGGGMMGGGM